MAFELLGPRKFQASRDSYGDREYKVTYLVGTTSNQEGPCLAMQTPGLPATGSTYAYGTGEVDVWAWCRPEIDVVEVGGHQDGDFPYHFLVTRTFSTKTRPRDQERPHKQNGSSDNDVMNPLNEPQKISGGFLRFTEQGLVDRFGNRIRNSAWELIAGPNNEWDNSRDVINVEQNVLFLERTLISSMRDCVNSTPMWGYPVRSIKLSEFDWSKHWVKGVSYYYTRRFKFEARVKLDNVSRTILITITNGSNIITLPGLVAFQSSDIGRTLTGTGIAPGTTISSLADNNYTAILSNPATASGTNLITLGATNFLVGDWDRDVNDEGTKALRGHWNVDGVTPRYWVTDAGVDKNNPSDFINTQDTNGNFGKVFLNGAGIPHLPSRDGTDPAKIHIEKYPQANFALLGVPLDF